MRTFVKFVLLAEAFAVATYGLGWWIVPVIALVWGLLARGAGKARFAALAATTGWATLLLLDVSRGPVSVMATQLGAVMNVPSFVLYILTLIFPGLLAFCTTTLVPTVRKTATA